MRYYDPLLRRFLQPDPSSQDGVRSYVYCHDDPANCTDPSGLAGLEEGENKLPGAGWSLPPGDALPPSVPAGERVAFARRFANALRGTFLPESSDITVVIGPDGELLDDASGSYDPATFDRTQAIADARAARQYLGGKFRSLRMRLRKVGVATDSGIRTISGWAQSFFGQSRASFGLADPVQLDVLDSAATMGVDFESNVQYDQGIAGQAAASHAEAQAEEITRGSPSASSWPACAGCSNFLSASAQWDSLGTPRVLADPFGVTIYYPDGTIELVAEQAYPESTTR